MHTYIHAYIHPCMHAYIHTYLHTYIHTYIRTYIHTYTHIHTHTYTHTYIHIWDILYYWSLSAETIQTTKAAAIWIVLIAVLVFFVSDLIWRGLDWIDTSYTSHHKKSMRCKHMHSQKMGTSWIVLLSSSPSFKIFKRGLRSPLELAPCQEVLPKQNLGHEHHYSNLVHTHTHIYIIIYTYIL